MTLIVVQQVSIPEDELEWSYARSGGPGGQNVNKVSSKVLLRWKLSANSTVPAAWMERLRTQQANRITGDGELMIQSQLTRDQDRNREDCLEKLRQMILRASIAPRPRKATRPTKASKTRRLNDKKQRSSVKAARRSKPDAD